MASQGRGRCLTPRVSSCVGSDMDDPSCRHTDVDLAVVISPCCADQSENLRAEARVGGQEAWVERVLDEERFAQP